MSAWSIFAICWIIWVLVVSVTSSVEARDMGQFAKQAPISQETKAWIKDLKSPAGIGCCSTADGYPVDAQWDMESGKYRVWIEKPDWMGDSKFANGWYDVPDDAVIVEPNLLGYAVVWWYPDIDLLGVTHAKIRCFLRGPAG